MRRTLVAGVGLLVVAVAVALLTFARAESGEPPHCRRNALDAQARAAAVTGSGPRVVVLGDSWSAGWGLDVPARSWPVELDGRVHVDAFSGSGFSAGATVCRERAYADRARRAVRAVAEGATARTGLLVVVQGGLNDTDQPEREVRAGVRRLLTVLEGHDVVLVGPADAPARYDDAARVDALLAEEADRGGARYVSVLDLELDYMEDGLHLTAEGHRELGRAVAARLAR